MDETFRVQPIPFQNFYNPVMPPAETEDRSMLQRITDWIGEKSGLGGVDESYKLTGDEARFDVETNYSPWGEAMMAIGGAHLAESAALSGRDDAFEDAVKALETNQARSETRREIVGNTQWALEQASVPASMLLAVVPGGAYGRAGYGALRAAGTRLFPRAASNPAVVNAARSFTTGGASTGIFGRGMEFFGNRMLPSWAAAASASREIPGEIGGAGISEAASGAGYGLGRFAGAAVGALPFGKTTRAIGAGIGVVGSILGGWGGYGVGEDYANRIFEDNRRNWYMSDWKNWDWMKQNHPEWITPEIEQKVEARRY